MRFWRRIQVMQGGSAVRAILLPAFLTLMSCATVDHGVRWELQSKSTSELYDGQAVWADSQSAAADTLQKSTTFRDVLEPIVLIAFAAALVTVVVLGYLYGGAAAP